MRQCNIKYSIHKITLQDIRTTISTNSSPINLADAEDDEFPLPPRKLKVALFKTPLTPRRLCLILSPEV